MTRSTAPIADAPGPGSVDFVGAGPGDPDLLTVGAARLIMAAKTVVHDRLVSAEILDMIPADATRIDVGKTGFGPSWKQEDINALLIRLAADGPVLRLKGGDCGIFGRLDEEIDALESAGIAYRIMPGITAAAAASAAVGLGLTRRGRNSALRILTGYQVEGFADHDWRSLADRDAVAAIYMGKAASAYLRGRLLMHGAAPDKPVTIVENASRPDQRIVATTLLTLTEQLADMRGPAVLLLGIAPRHAPALLKGAL